MLEYLKICSRTKRYYHGNPLTVQDQTCQIKWVLFRTVSHASSRTCLCSKFSFIDWLFIGFISNPHTHDTCHSRFEYIFYTLSSINWMTFPKSITSDFCYLTKAIERKENRIMSLEKGARSYQQSWTWSLSGSPNSYIIKKNQIHYKIILRYNKIKKNRTNLSSS